MNFWDIMSYVYPGPNWIRWGQALFGGSKKTTSTRTPASPYTSEYQNILKQLNLIIQGQHPYFRADISQALLPIQEAISAQTQALTSAAQQNLAGRGLAGSGLAGAVARDIGIAGQAQLGRAAAQLQTQREAALRQAILSALSGQMSLLPQLERLGLSREELEFMKRRFQETLSQQEANALLNAITQMIGSGAMLLPLII